MKVLSVDGLSKLITLMKGEFASSSQIPTTTSQLTNNSGFITGISWGDITGTLSSQSDLNTALNNKANDSSVVHLSGDETINGGKTFNQAFIIGTTETHPNEGGQLIFKKSHNSTMAGDVIVDQNVNNLRVIGQSTSLGIIVPFYIDCENNKVYTATPATGDNSTQVATTAFVKAQGYATTSQIPTIDQTYDATSSNAQSGVAIAGAGFLTNNTTSPYSWVVSNTASNQDGLTILGKDSSSTKARSTVLGRSAQSTGKTGIVIGYASYASADHAIQIGTGTNSVADTLNIGFDNDVTTDRKNWCLLDGTTGLIPDARISTNIARTSNIPTVNDSTITIQKNGTTVDSFTTNASSGKTINITVPTTAADVSAVASNTAITGATKCKITYDSKGLVTAGANLSASDIPDISATYQTKLTSGTNIKTINSTSLLGSGDISITGLPSQTSQSGKFLTTNGTSASWATVTQPSIATTSTAGLVKPDGTSITIDANGTISAAGGSAYAMVIVDYTEEDE